MSSEEEPKITQRGAVPSTKNVPDSLPPDEDPDFNHPGEPPLQSMFNKTRIHPFNWKTHIPFYLYLPFGIVLGILRFVGSFVIAIPFLTIFGFFDMEWIFWQTFGYVFNFWSYVRNPDMLATPEEAPILCCNHVTDFDGVAFFPIQLTKHAVEITTSFLRPLATAALKLGWKMIIIYRETDPARRHLTKDQINAYFASPESKKRQLFVLAEGATTNGKVGLLQYNRFCFSLGKPVQPLYVRVRPHLPINIDVPSKNMFPNWFWFMFCPGCTFEYTCLPVQHIQENETPEEFAHRVQKMTADALGIACTTYSYKHKNKLKKVVR